MKKLKNLKNIIRCIITIMLIAISANKLMAMEMDKGASFSVAPILPDNQNKESSYFDLSMLPGQKQTINVVVKNMSDEEIKIKVETITASTSNNGEINYSIPGNMDESLKHGFSDISKLPNDKYTIPKKESINVPIEITMPEDELEGIILGSVRVLKELNESEKNSKQPFINQYAYVIAVKIHEKEYTNIEPDFKIKEDNSSIEVGLVDYRASITLNIVNPKPMIYKKAVVETKIYPKGKDISIFETKRDKVDFAPNSIYSLVLSDDAGYGIAPGEYTAKTSLSYNGKNWKFEKSFSISEKEAKDINESSLNQTEQRRYIQELPTNLLLILMVVIGIILVVAISILITIIKLKKNEKM